ncbi:MAG: hypothetical protein M3Q45_14535 [Chloroflexota bacterium]|nr:hypothetical protein [Chloroflexota bacterium]
MAKSGRRWLVYDRDDNPVYLTEERWQHIVDPNNHIEMVDYEEHLKATIAKGRRQQEPLNPRKYRYVHSFADLPEGINHIVAIVLFGFDMAKDGCMNPNNYVTTAFLKHIGLKGSKK